MSWWRREGLVPHSFSLPAKHTSGTAVARDFDEVSAAIDHRASRQVDDVGVWHWAVRAVPSHYQHQSRLLLIGCGGAVEGDDIGAVGLSEVACNSSTTGALR